MLKNIKFALIRQNIKDYELAEKVGITPTYLSEIIHCKKIPTVKIAKKISSILKEPIETLFNYDED